MTPPTVNAYYNPLENNINFPAGILQPPFYSAKADAAVNFGGAGAVIGHELTHGFDDQGRQFDARGNLKDWWTPADAKAFEERAQCFVDEYAGFTAVDDVKLNGKLTLGENTADNGGLRIALMAYLARTAGRAGARRSTASRPSSACSSAGARCGARTSARSARACSRRPTRTRPAAIASTASSRTCRSSRRRSRARPARRWCARTSAGCGRRRRTFDVRRSRFGGHDERRATTSTQSVAERRSRTMPLGDGPRADRLLRALPAAADATARRSRARRRSALPRRDLLGQAGPGLRRSRRAGAARSRWRRRRTAPTAPAASSPATAPAAPAIS